MRYRIIALLVLAMSCKSNDVRNTEGCDADFDVFFKKFASDSTFQKQHFDFPVMEYYSDEDFPLDLLERHIDEESYVFVDFTGDKTLYDISVEKKKDSVIYTRRMRDRHHLPMIYKFAQNGDCWMLVEFSDLTD
ncbi:MAG TPA: DUF4348 domain-containing protein [Flavobacterium sp.]|nr:DUF4348 domain-containing protein [Flavobacterium sp.]